MQEIKYISPWHEYSEELFRAKMDWEEGVPCKAQGPHRMYPPSEEGQKIVALDVCKGCPAQVRCLELALVTKEDEGVWGGATERQRRELRKELSKDFQLSDRKIWRDGGVKEAVLAKAKQFVEAQNTEHNTATVGQ